MVKIEKNKCINLLKKKINFSYKCLEFILPNKGFKKFELNSNKV